MARIRREDRHIFLERHPPPIARPASRAYRSRPRLQCRRGAARISTVKKSWNMSWRRNLEKYTRQGEGNKEAGDQGLALVKVSPSGVSSR